jgi:hypothetical protein
MEDLHEKFAEKQTGKSAAIFAVLLFARLQKHLRSLPPILQ